MDREHHDDTGHLTEPVPIDDDLCTKLAMLEDLGFGVRFVFAVEQTIYETGEHAMAAKRKIILPYTEIVPALQTTARFLAQRPHRLKLLK